MPNRDKGAAASSYVFAASDLNEPGRADAFTDSELMLAVAEANPKAFSILMERHVPMMVALARRITLNAQDADDVVQEAFLRVWVNAPRWDVHGPALFRTWLHRIVANLAIDRTRKPKNLPLEAAGDPPDLRENVEAHMQQGDEARQVHQALAQLPPRQRAAVALYYFDEMTAGQAADVLGLSLGATEALLVRARKGLRHFLDDTKKGLRS